MLYVVIYQENHPDRNYKLVGVFSSEEKAEKAIEQDLASRKKFLSLSSRVLLGRSDYWIHKGNLDEAWF